MDLEGRGIPAVYVATTEFETAAKAQAEGLGAAPEGVFVPHPIQDRTDEELVALADGALEQIERALLGTKSE